MRYKDIIEETLTSLFVNKARTFLTALGIVIGIASVITLMAIGNGASQTIQSSIESLGSNLLFVTPGATKSFGAGPRGPRGEANSLTLDDMNAIQSELSDISGVAGEVSAREQIIYKANNDNVSISGVTPEYFQVRNIDLAVGDGITESDILSNAKVAVVGPDIITTLFGDGIDPSEVIGVKFKIKSYEFEIVGVTESKGGSTLTSSDDAIYIPVSTAQRYLSGNKYLSTIYVSAASSKVTDNVQNEVTALLSQRHNIKFGDTADFTVTNQSSILSSATSITTTFTYLLAAIAGISLLVGGIGIMNMMLTTVTERTREIGLRKAIGATSKDIANQFLIEALALTLLGGIAGVILGFLIAYSLTYFNLVQASVSWSSVLLAFGVSSLIGVVFGYYPAKRASKLNPIDALRYE